MYIEYIEILQLIRIFYLKHLMYTSKEYDYIILIPCNFFTLP